MLEEPAEEVIENWDFYATTIHNRPALISLNLGFDEMRGWVKTDVRYLTTVDMVEPDDNGVGSATEIRQTYASLDKVDAAVRILELFKVGVVRYNGRWRIIYYGTAGLESLISSAFAGSFPERNFEVEPTKDSNFVYFDDVLCPGPLEQLWMDNRARVSKRAENGDEGSEPRPVKHYTYFGLEESAQKFGSFARSLGFTVSQQVDQRSDLKYSLHLVRNDPTDLDHIHEISCALAVSAIELEGEYDGWNAPVVKRG